MDKVSLTERFARFRDHFPHARPVVGRAGLGLVVVLNAGLFVGSLVFLASGQCFEQFRGIE